MIFLLYRVLQILLSPALLVYFLYRGLQSRPYFATLSERLGSLPPTWKQTTPGAIWLHAVSVGEILAAVPLLREIRSARPKIHIFVSTTTRAGRAIAESRLRGLTENIFYAPLDFTWCVRRVLRHLKPSLVLIMETEIWPNLFREVTRLGAGLAIVNGRISDRALPRYERFSGLFTPVLSLCDRILVQSEEMKERYVSAGAPPDIVSVTGNLKYDFVPVDIAPDSALRSFIGSGQAPIWIAASTSADDKSNEESAVFAAQRELSGWRLIIAPRKPERFAEAAAMLSRSGLRWTRRTELDSPQPDLHADVLLLDSIGELSGLFSFADVVFMGGSLVERGGHNILEPASFGKPVIVGPHMENFRDITVDFEAQNALIRIQLPHELAAAVLGASKDFGVGERARLASQAKSGTTARTLKTVFHLYDSRYPRERAPQPWYAIGLLLAQLWRVGSAYDRRRKSRRARSLPVPVISIGNITAGGTGKTPVTIELLERLTRLHQPAGLLLRGHRRIASRPVVITDANAKVPFSHTGDEAQLYLGRLNSPIGIHRDRFRVGRFLVKRTSVKMLLLDDGFQHLQLKRNFDLVLIDALHPFGGGYLLPLGRLREPLSGLSRADAFLITRSDEVPCTTAISAVLRRHNPHAPVYHARTVAREWRTFGDRKATIEEVIALGPVVAFCGLGNPNSFWRTLRQIGVAPLEQLEYDDHHRYTPSELRRLVRHAADMRAGGLVTTAKDAVNLCEDCENICAPLHLYWLEIGVEIDDDGKLIDRILALA